MIFAFATDDKENLMSRHFGDANFYAIYEITSDSVKFVKLIENTVDEEEEIHADPKKAGGIAKLLKAEKVEVSVSKVFGPNIKRIIKKFLCIISTELEIEKLFPMIQKNFAKIEEEYQKGKERKWLNFVC